MPPKKRTGENNVSKKSFTLIWWVEEGSKDIIPASKLPRKNRTIGSIVKLKWETFQKKKVELHDAKIIAFDTNYEKLNNILLDDKGNILQRINSLEDELSTTPSLFERLQSNIKSSKLPVSKVSAGPVVTNVEVIGNSMILDESQSLRNTQSKVSSSSNNREFQLIDYSKVNYDVSTIEPLDFSKANETVFSTTTADNNSTIEKSGTPGTPEKITDEQSLLEKTTGLQSTQEDITGAASTFSGETIMNDGIEVKRIEDIEAHDISIGALHTFMPNDFTEDDVRSFLKVYAGLEDAHKYQSKNNAKLCVTTQIPNDFSAPGDNKVLFNISLY
ncbi:uncharacterized protein LOC123273361 [Cotesia glomerata]|uniref:uncharacterized protein LOC123273361 n=1 Tax=Cotesia glomerata TaxID=32391 RepID=UPI001D020DE2|nr:uncharacterized protein LOC123273361 [Cotesia glomerata]